MKLIVRCNCGQKYLDKAANMGRRFRCEVCGGDVLVWGRPAASEASPRDEAAVSFATKLASPDCKVRQQALTDLGYYARAAFRSDGTVSDAERVSLLLALAPEIIATVADRVWAVSRAAVDLLAEMYHPDAIEPIIDHAMNHHPFEAIHAVGRILETRASVVPEAVLTKVTRQTVVSWNWFEEVGGTGPLPEGFEFQYMPPELIERTADSSGILGLAHQEIRRRARPALWRFGLFEREGLGDEGFAVLGTEAACVVALHGK